MQLEETIQCLVGYATEHRLRKTGTPAASPNAVRPNAEAHLGHSQALITRAVLTSCCGHFFCQFQRNNLLNMKVK